VQEKLWEAHSFKLSRLVFCLNQTFQRAVWHFSVEPWEGTAGAWAVRAPQDPATSTVYTQPRTVAIQ
jgi:hypothetical protein